LPAAAETSTPEPVAETPVVQATEKKNSSVTDSQTESVDSVNQIHDVVIKEAVDATFVKEKTPLPGVA
jgi:hypothetical protein